jgi:hypothetical protein
MRLRPERRAKRGIAVVSLWVIAALTASCSATPPATGPPPPTAVLPTRPSPSTHATHSAPAAHPAPSTAGFTVAGNNPVQVNGSQDTDAAIPDATCDSTQFAADKALGREIAGGFALENFPAAANLLTHFLAGTGTAVGFGIGSAIAKEAAASSEFQAVNTDVQSEIALRLKAKVTRVQLSAAQLPTVLFSAKSSDLYWGFRGTQGLTVTGSGTRKNGKYVGTLTYVIRDSYGFPVDDTLAGFGPPMRYLQTVCGAPQHPGGAHWFPDTITLSVPFTA